MKKILSVVLATTVFGLAGAASAQGMNDVVETYKADAFDNADDRWRRITANRIDECGNYGDTRNSRLNVLIDRYQAIGEAMAQGNNAGAERAAKALSEAINANSRFEKCWTKVARRAGVSRDFTDAITAMSS